MVSSNPIWLWEAQRFGSDIADRVISIAIKGERLIEGSRAQREAAVLQDQLRANADVDLMAVVAASVPAIAAETERRHDRSS